MIVQLEGSVIAIQIDRRGDATEATAYVRAYSPDHALGADLILRDQRLVMHLAGDARLKITIEITEEGANTKESH